MMRRKRVIPILLIHKGQLYKSLKFKDLKYVGDPINTVRIFNEKEVDEIVVLDIDASIEKRPPNFDLISDIASEAFMPLSYGGGISDINHVKRIMQSGVEKVVFNYASFYNEDLIKQTINHFGSSSTVVCIDAKKGLFGGYSTYILNGKKDIKLNPKEMAVKLQELGVGEIIINSIDRDGTMAGYDVKLISDISSLVSIPIVACGGAGKMSDFSDAVAAGASAVAAGSFFIFHGPHRAVLITYPSERELKILL